MFKTWTKTGTSTCYQKEMTLASNVALDFRKFPNFLSHFHIVWKWLNRIVAFEILNFGIFHQFCPFKID